MPTEEQVAELAEKLQGVLLTRHNVETVPNEYEDTVTREAVRWGNFFPSEWEALARVALEYVEERELEILDVFIEIRPQEVIRLKPIAKITEGKLSRFTEEDPQ